MQTRYRAAATALLMTATAGLAATGGAAEASGTHHAGAGAAKSLTITIKATAGGVKLSDTKFRPGNTIFKVKNMDGKASRGLIQLMRLKPGYSQLQAFGDLNTMFSDDPSTPPADILAAIHRVDRHIVFYGGMEAAGKPSKVAKWAVKIDKPGRYLVVNFDQQQVTPFKAKGDKQKRSLPTADGFINAVPGPGGVGNAFKPGRHNAASGWMSTSNSAQEPHFVVLQHVKKGTTNRDVSDYFADPAAPPVPPFAAKDGAGTDTGVISPGHTFLWTYDLPKGRYVTMCFWPSKTEGMPHAVMGMHAVFNQG